MTNHLFRHLMIAATALTINISLGNAATLDPGRLSIFARWPAAARGGT
jgi:hypothetical protein